MVTSHISIVQYKKQEVDNDTYIQPYMLQVLHALIRMYVFSRMQIYPV